MSQVGRKWPTAAPTSMSASLPISPGNRLAAPGQLRSRLICAHCGRSWLARPLSKADIMSADALGSFGRSGQQTTKRRPANRTSSDISGRPAEAPRGCLGPTAELTPAPWASRPHTHGSHRLVARSSWMVARRSGEAVAIGEFRAWSCWWRRDAEGRGSERTEAD